MAFEASDFVKVKDIARDLFKNRIGVIQAVNDLSFVDMQGNRWIREPTYWVYFSDDDSLMLFHGDDLVAL
jgi:hypothetical protein